MSSQAYGRHALPFPMAQKVALAKAQKLNRRLLKGSTLPHHASMHPKAVTDYLCRRYKKNKTTEPRTYKAQQPRREGNALGAKRAEH